MDGSKIHYWRSRAKFHREEKERLKRRFKEVVHGRSQWKARSSLYLSERNELRIRVRKLESQLSNLSHLSDRASGHRYPLWLVSLCLCLRNHGHCSLRVCSELVRILGLILALELGSPSPSTISHWEGKAGLYHLKRSNNSRGNWCLFIDESLVIGRQKILLLLGLALNDYSFTKAPNFSDVEVLYLGVAPSWKGNQIARILQELTAQGHQFVYSPSDQGNNLVKALKDQKIPRIADCTHAFSKIVERRYQSDPLFQGFVQACAQMRKRLVISKYAAILPPAQRTKARFLNLGRITQWANKMLRLLDQLNQTENPIKARINEELAKGYREELAWLGQYQTLIKELEKVNTSIDQLFKLIKQKGLSHKTSQESLELLKQNQVPEFLQEAAQKYFQSNLNILEQIPQKICCSDVIESFFGKFKRIISQNPNQGITGACLRIASFGKKQHNHEIKQALEKVTVKQIRDWTQVNIPPNLIQLKNSLCKNGGKFFE